VSGIGSIVIERVASLADAKELEIAFLEDEKHIDSALSTKASCLIVPDGLSGLEGKCLISVARPKLAFALIAELLHPHEKRQPSIHPMAVVASGAKLDARVFIDAHAAVGEGARVGEGTQILHGASIGKNVIIGSDCIIHPNVVLYDDVKIGDRVILHASVVIGADGFGYVPDEKNALHKFPQIGTVVIEDDVEIGAGSCVDRGALGETRIGRGSKIDNLVQIAHNVRIGERVVIAAQTGISGSTIIEDDAVIGGQVGLGDHAHVQSGAVIGSKAGILPGKIVRKGVWWGIPVQPLEDYKRLNAHMNRLPQLREEVKELQRRVKELEEEETDDK
jgi:UDP-3-O-[3-hydroxymyristoyl] glucosamine N-acyltransferase